MTLEELHASWEDCIRCPLAEHRQRTVPGYGNPRARIFCISDKPGAIEDESGVPMTGPAGDYYTQTLQRLGLEMEDVWTTNCVMCLPPDNRDPFDSELAACRERLLQEILLVDPYIIVVMGRVTLHSLLGVRKPISKCQLKTFLLTVPGVQNLSYPAVVTYNPAWIRKHNSLGRGQPWHYMYRALELARDTTNTLEEIYAGPRQPDP